MGYIRDLRALVGHRPIIMVGAAVAIIDALGHLLLQRRADNGLWGLPGGSMEPGESIEETARREVLEETGLTVGSLTLFGVFSGKDQFFEYPNGDQIYDVCVAFLTRDFNGSICLDSDETTGVRFFRMDALPSKVTPLDKPILDRLKNT